MPVLAVGDYLSILSTAHSATVALHDAIQSIKNAPSEINEIKSVLPDGVRVGTADSWNKYADGTADAVIQGGVDIL